MGRVQHGSHSNFAIFLTPTLYTHAVPARHSTFHVHVASLARASNGVALLLHGGGFTGVSWAPLVQHLAASCCCIAPDLRAHGLTTTSDDLDLVSTV
jgi:pimeloyl-ACP methyl ester carboxylesterase